MQLYSSFPIFFLLERTETSAHLSLFLPSLNVVVVDVQRAGSAVSDPAFSAVDLFPRLVVGSLLHEPAAHASEIPSGTQ